jgi:hypothetical protein
MTYADVRGHTPTNSLRVGVSERHIIIQAKLARISHRVS